MRGHDHARVSVDVNVNVNVNVDVNVNVRLAAERRQQRHAHRHASSEPHRAELGRQAARDPLDVSSEAQGVELRGYVDSWKSRGDGS